MTAPNLLAPFKRIRVKAALFVLLLLFSVTAGLYLITLRIMSQRIVGEVVRRAESLCRSTASAAGYSISSRDLLGLDNLVFRIKSINPDIEYIAITDTDGKVLVHNDVSRTGELFSAAEGTVARRDVDGTVMTDVRDASGGRFEIRSPIIFMEKPLGAVVLGINKTVPIAAQKEAGRKMLLIFGSVLILGVVSSLVLSSFLTRPIKELSAGVTELKEGRLNSPLRVYSLDELGRLTQSFNEMTALITVQRDELGKYAQELEQAYVSTVRVLAAAIDARDAYTLGHSTRVAKLSVELGRDLGLSHVELEDLEVACLFHDVGKIKIPDSILLKRGRLGGGGTHRDDAAQRIRRGDPGQGALPPQVYSRGPPPPRVARRKGVPGRAGGRPDPVGRGHHRPRGCLRRHDIGQALPGRHDGKRGPELDRLALGQAVRTEPNRAFHPHRKIEERNTRLDERIE